MNINRLIVVDNSHLSQSDYFEVGLRKARLVVIDVHNLDLNRYVCVKTATVRSKYCQINCRRMSRRSYDCT